MSDSELLVRIENLERDNRRLKKLGVAALVLVGALGLIAATRPRPVPDLIKAHKFEVVDGLGRGRIVLFASGSGANNISGLSLIGPDGQINAQLTSSANVSGLFLGRNLLDKSNPTPIVLGVEYGQPALEMLGAKGTSASIKAFSSGPSLSLRDDQGYLTETGSASLVTPKTGETHHTSAASIVMFGNGKKHHVIWQAP